MAEREEIEQVFRANLERVRGLVTLHEEIAPGRPGETVDDVLRAGVVLLHATLEDLLRSLEEWKLPEAPSESLRPISFARSSKPKDKFDLGDLAEFPRPDRGLGHRPIRQAYLKRSSYNQLGVIVAILQRIGRSYDVPARQKAELAAMMNRRHQIAHRADRISHSETERQIANQISASDVNNWIAVVEGLGTEILTRA